MRGVDPRLVELFAYLQDSWREADGADPGHGGRAADYAAALNGRFFDLDRARLDRLCFAIERHSDGQMDAAPAIQTSWDGDRLDLGRIGRQPSPRLFSPEAAALIGESLSESALFDPTQDPTEPRNG